MIVSAYGNVNNFNITVINLQHAIFVICSTLAFVLVSNMSTNIYDHIDSAYIIIINMIIIYFIIMTMFMI